MKTIAVLRFLVIALTLGLFACKSDSTSSNNATVSGDPKLTASPTVSPASGSSGQTVTVTVPVTSNALYVSAMIGTTAAGQGGGVPVGGTSPFYGSGYAVNSSGATSVQVAMKL